MPPPALLDPLWAEAPADEGQGPPDEGASAEPGEEPPPTAAGAQEEEEEGGGKQEVESGDGSQPPLPPPAGDPPGGGEAEEEQELKKPQAAHVEQHDHLDGEVILGLDAPHKEVVCVDPAAKVALDEASGAGSEAPEAGMREMVLFRAFARYVRVLQLCPCFFLLLYLVGIALAIGLAWRPFQLDDDLASFVKADGQAARDRDAFVAAYVAKKGMDTGVRRLSGRSDMPQWFQKSITVIYSARGGNMLDTRALKEARDFEARLRAIPGWMDFCVGRSTSLYPTWLCEPGDSFLAYVWPDQVQSDAPYRQFDLTYSGDGPEALPLPAVFQFLQDRWQAGEGRGDLFRYFPKGFNVSDYDNNPPAVIRSSFTFPIIYGTLSMPVATLQANFRKSQTDYEKFVTEEVYPVLTESPKLHEHIDIFYSGDVIDAYEVSKALEEDVLWALGSILFITLYLGIHVRSPMITAGCFFSIFASVPLAYVCTPASKTTFASLMSLFLITVIDIDIIFIFVDFWAQSEFMGELDARLAWTLLRAGRCCLATSVTTSLSFFANLKSALQPLREFGMFIGLCVMNVFILGMFVLPPVIVLRHQCARRRRPSKMPVSPEDPAQPAVEEECELNSALALRKIEEEEDRLICGKGGAEVTEGKELERCPSAREAEAAEKQEEGPREVPLHERLLPRAMSRLVDCIATCPLLILVLGLMCLAAFIVGIFLRAQLDTGTPQIFKPSHNQVRGKALASKFGALIDLSLDKLPSMESSVCRADNQSVDAQSAGLMAPAATASRPCVLEWCDAMSQGTDEEPWGALEGDCWRGPTMLLSSTGPAQNIGWRTDVCDRVQIQTRVASQARAGSTFLTTWSREYLAQLKRLVNGSQEIPNSWVQVQALQSLVLEDWETGTVSLSNFHQADAIQARKASSDRVVSVCSFDAMCFFGPRRCQQPGWQRLGHIDLTRLGDSSLKSRRLEAETPARQLVMFQPTVPVNRQIVVEVVWGVWAPRSTPLVGPTAVPWLFDPLYEPENPWAQRAVMAMCSDFPEELLVVSYDCWITNFHDWLYRSGLRFPSRDFDRDVVAWYRLYQDSVKTKVWVVDGKVRASVLAFNVDVSDGVDVYRALKYKTTWDDWVSTRNKAASISADRAYHTSPVWIRAEAQVAMIQSTAMTIVLECALGWFGILVFTGDLALAFIALGLIVGNMAGLAFFMIVLMEWQIGPIEIIFLVVFLGYSVAFGLHMALNYNQALPADVQLLAAEAWARERLARRKRRKEDSYIREGAADAAGAADADAETAAALTDADAAAAALADADTVAARAAVDEPLVLREGREMRKARVRMAVIRVGGAILSTSVCTLGSSVFLFFCSMNIFIRLGLVIVAVNVLSLLSTLLVMPAVLVLMGPSTSPWYKRLPAEWWRRATGRRASPPPSTIETPLLE